MTVKLLPATVRGRILAVLGILLAAGGGLAWYLLHNGAAPTPFRKAAVRRADLLATVSATGTIEPEETVDIGAQVVGMIQEFGRDPQDSTRLIDYGSVVDEGTVLARIDDSLYRARADRAAAQVEVAQAQVEHARADLRRAEADLGQAQAKDRQATRDWERAQKLWGTRSLSESEHDGFLAAYDVGRANVGVAKAAVDQARAALLQAEKSLNSAQADLREAQKNLDYTTIRSPVKGVIVDRRVNIGQTVVASLNAPSLFLIAKDLRRLQIWAAVNEADIGSIRQGQAVRFTVDAYPDEVFRGTVAQVRLNATMTQNVVTYTVVVSTDNPDGRLLPYLTANIQFEIARRRNVLVVPNAALRWQPQPYQAVPEARAALAGEEGAPAGDRKRSDRGLVWVEERGLVRPVEVRIGLTDGVRTEVVGGKLSEGDQVVIGEQLEAEAGDAGSPFAPRMFGGRR